MHFPPLIIYAFLLNPSLRMQFALDLERRKGRPLKLVLGSQFRLSAGPLMRCEYCFNTDLNVKVRDHFDLLCYLLARNMILYFILLTILSRYSTLFATVFFLLMYHYYTHSLTLSLFLHPTHTPHHYYYHHHLQCTRDSIRSLKLLLARQDEEIKGLRKSKNFEESTNLIKIRYMEQEM